MKHLSSIVVLSALLAAPAVAQQPPTEGADVQGSSAEVRQHLAQAREGAQTQALAALSSDHQAKVNALLMRVKDGQLTDLHDAAQQIDAVLTPTEAQAVLAARDKLMADAPSMLPGSGPPTPGGSGPRQQPPPPAGRDRARAGHAMRNDAGFAFLFLGLDPDQLRSLFTNSHAPQ